MKKIIAILSSLAIILLMFGGCDPADPLRDDLYTLGDIYIWDGAAWVPVVAGGGGDVTAAANLTTDFAIVGDGGLKGVKTSTVMIDNFGNLVAPGDITSGQDINSGNDVNVVNDLDVTDDADIGGDLGVVGSAYFGGIANYTVISADGTLTMLGTARVLNAIWIDAGGIKAPGAKPATEVAHGVLEVPAWRFADQALVANQESVSFSIRIPERMDRTVSPTIIIGWSTTTTDPDDDSEQVKWQLEYVWRSQDESTIVGPQETLTVLTTASAIAEGFRASTFIGIDIPSGTDICIHCRLTRLSADAEDTVADDVELLGVCLQWTSDKLGQ